jgi:hypothetical protein
MGKTVFICKVDTVAAMEAACRSIYMHNTAEMKALGGSYTDDEFKNLDLGRQAI